MDAPNNLASDLESSSLVGGGGGPLQHDQKWRDLYWNWEWEVAEHNTAVCSITKKALNVDQ